MGLIKDVPVNENTLTDRELFIYISTSLSFNPLLDGLEKTTKTKILKDVLKEMDLKYISNGDVYQIMQTIELFREKLGLALNKVIDANSLSIVREKVLSQTELIEQSMKMIENNPELIKKIQKALSEK